MSSAKTAPLLVVHGLHKRYAVPVLSDVDFDLLVGEVHALVGANGAGKSTLSKIICGLTLPNAGRMTMAGRPYAPKRKSDAERHGIHMVMQELNLIPTLSIAENMYFNCLPRRRGGFVDFREMNRLATGVLAMVGLEALDPAMAVSRLGVGHQQLLEIAAALSRQCRLLILDEPTAALTDSEIALLFGHIRRLKDEGVGIIYISHRMEEIRRIADRVTVLRDGRVITTGAAEDLSVHDMVCHMAGRELVEHFDFGERAFGEVALRVEGLRRGALVRDVSFEVRRGEILGFAGLVGSGRTEMTRAIFGADRPEAGTVYLGQPLAPVVIGQPRDAVRAGLGLIPEDRKQDGLMLSQPVRTNISLARIGSACRAGCWIDRNRENEATGAISRSLDVRGHSLEQPVAELSGGNQQKVLVGRWLMRDCDVILFDEPTRGVDVAAKETIYELLGDLARRGKALVIVSSDLAELMAICDRIAVMSLGRLVATFGRDEWTQEKIMAASFSEHLGRDSSREIMHDD